jgi:transposase-like protein
LEDIIEDQMAAAVDRYLDQLQADDAADCRNGYYRRHLLTELSDIELNVPDPALQPTEVIRAYARRMRAIDRVILAASCSACRPGKWARRCWRCLVAW